jgi:hypothetical protein
MELLMINKLRGEHIMYYLVLGEVPVEGVASTTDSPCAFT